jgi:hypothetical protein
MRSKVIGGKSLTGDMEAGEVVREYRLRLSSTVFRQTTPGLRRAIGRRDKKCAANAGSAIDTVGTNHALGAVGKERLGL